MSLKTELLGMVDKMQAVCDDKHDLHATQKIIQLRLLLAEMRGLARGMPEEQPPDRTWPPAGHPQVVPGGMRLVLPGVDPVLEQMKAREQQQIAKQQEAAGVVMRECAGGPADDTTVATHPQMPVGARCSVAGCTYELHADGLLRPAPRGAGK